MKTRFLFLMLFVVSCGFSQTINDYKVVIIPMRYEFQKSENQYRMQTMSKANLIKAGFVAYYANEPIPAEYNDRCKVLYLDVKQDNSFLTTKLFITFKDCNNGIVFQSAVGKSREKEYQVAYSDAFNKAFESVIALGYVYNGGLNVATKSTLISPPVSVQKDVAVFPDLATAKKEVNETASSENKNVLFAQPTSYGYQLIDSEPKVVMKLYKTSNPASFMAKRGEVQGALVSKENQWFFEYYQGDKLISEKIDVKF